MTSIADTTDWIDRCVDRMLFRDPELDAYDAEVIAEELSTRDRWRALSPEEAADRTFEPGRWSDH